MVWIRTDRWTSRELPAIFCLSLPLINIAELQINLEAEYIFERQACYKKMFCFQKSFHPIIIRKEDFDPSTEYRITRAACID